MSQLSSLSLFSATSVCSGKVTARVVLWPYLHAKPHKEPPQSSEEETDHAAAFFIPANGDSLLIPVHDIGSPLMAHTQITVFLSGEHPCPP